LIYLICYHPRRVEEAEAWKDNQEKTIKREEEPLTKSYGAQTKRLPGKQPVQRGGAELV